MPRSWWGGGGLSKTSALRATGVPSLHDTGKGDKGGSVPADLGPGPWGSGLCFPRNHPTLAVWTEQKQSWTQTRGQPWKCQVRAPVECGVIPRASEGSIGGGRRGLVSMGRRAGMALSGPDGQQASLCCLCGARPGHNIRGQEADTPQGSKPAPGGDLVPSREKLLHSGDDRNTSGCLPSGQYPGHRTCHDGAVREAVGLAKSSDWPEEREL